MAIITVGIDLAKNVFETARTPTVAPRKAPTSGWGNFDWRDTSISSVSSLPGSSNSNWSMRRESILLAKIEIERQSF